MRGNLTGFLSELFTASIILGGLLLIAAYTI